MHWYAYVIPGPGQGAAQPCPSLIEAIDVDTEEMLGIVREGKGEKCIGFAAWGVIIGTYHMIGKSLPSSLDCHPIRWLKTSLACYKKTFVISSDYHRCKEIAAIGTWSLVWSWKVSAQYPVNTCPVMEWRYPSTGSRKDHRKPQPYLITFTMVLHE